MSGQEAQAGDSSRGETVRAFCEAIAELRSFGEGFILSSQRPSELAESAVANTSVRILQRMEGASDRDVAMDDLNATDLDREAAARLGRGEAVVSWAELGEPEIIRVSVAQGVDSTRRVSDETVSGRMQEHSKVTRSLLPYSLCSREVCMEGCKSDVRAEGSQLASDVEFTASGIWNEAGDRTRSALEPIAEILANRSERVLEIAYCAAVHLSVSKSAFTTRRRIDLRPEMIEGIRKAVKGAQT